MKKTERYITKGVRDLGEKMPLYRFFSIADRLHTQEQYFLSFKPHGELTLVTDKDGNRLDTIKMEIPDVLLCVRKDYGDYYITTLMFASEY